MSKRRTPNRNGHKLLIMLFINLELCALSPTNARPLPSSRTYRTTALPTSLHVCVFAFCLGTTRLLSFLYGHNLSIRNKFDFSDCICNVYAFVRARTSLFFSVYSSLFFVGRACMMNDGTYQPFLDLFIGFIIQKKLLMQPD